jgi:hypothetical protein
MSGAVGQREMLQPLPVGSDTGTIYLRDSGSDRGFQWSRRMGVDSTATVMPETAPASRMSRPEEEFIG